MPASLCLPVPFWTQPIELRTQLSRSELETDVLEIHRQVLLDGAGEEQIARILPNRGIETISIERQEDSAEVWRPMSPSLVTLGISPGPTPAPPR